MRPAGPGRASTHQRKYASSTRPDSSKAWVSGSGTAAANVKSSATQLPLSVPSSRWSMR